MSTKLKQRNEIPDKYKWDIEDMYAEDEQWEARIYANLCEKMHALFLPEPEVFRSQGLRENQCSGAVSDRVEIFHCHAVPVIKYPDRTAPGFFP